MSTVRGPAGLLVVLATLLIATGATAAPPPLPGEKAALAAVKEAVKSGRIDRATAAGDRAEIRRAVQLARGLPPGRRVHVEVALEEVGALTGRLTKPRSVAVFGQLRANDDYFAKHGAPAGGTDITGSDGIVYRYFAGRCFEFHPLANVSTLNAHVAAKDTAAAQQLADALVARGVPRPGGGVGWEYYFRFGAGSPWVSGMVQAVAAQALARAASLVPGESAALLREASAAYRAIPGRLTTKVAAGPWIRLYSFSSVPVLNAQLQSVLSLESYAKATGDSSAATLAGQMERAAAATLPQFDTGYWTYYSLAGDSAPLSYHKFVIQLLRKLAPDDPSFAQAADRFAAYLRQPPAFKLANAPAGELRFWLSKPAYVSVVTATGSGTRLSLGGGWHTLQWRQPKRAGIYGIRVSAIGPAGNRTSFAALPLVRVTGEPQRAKSRTSSGAGSTTAPLPVFAVGAGIDGPAQAARAGSLGLGLVRMTIPWQAGETSPAPGVVGQLRSIPSGLGLVVELSASQLPSDAAGRAALGSYAASLAGQVPALRDLVLTPAPSAATASAYADALAATRAAVEGVRSEVAVGPVVDGSAQPQKTTLALAKRLARDRTTADVVAFRPAADSGSGNWAAGDVGRLEATLAQSLRPAPPVLLEAVAIPTTVPQSELSAYAGGAPPTQGAVSPASQAAMYSAAVGTASCSANVVGVLLDRLIDDGTTPQPATGLYYASGDPKPSGAAVKSAVAAAARGAVVCPGVAARVTPTTLMFPAQLATSSPASVGLGCSRDCLYLVTLERADGRPLAAARGALAGGGAPRTIALPRRKLAAGRYRLDVRLVSRVNPGILTRRLSSFLTVG